MENRRKFGNVSKKNKILERKIVFSINIKIILNYLQSISIVQDLNLKWPIIVKQFINLFSTAGNFSQGISFQCSLFYFNIGLEDIYFKTIFLIALPFVIFLLSGLFLFCFGVWKKKPQGIRFIVIIVVSSIFFQPNIIKTLFESLMCMEANGKWFLIVNKDINCNTSGYSFW